MKENISEIKQNETLFELIGDFGEKISKKFILRPYAWFSPKAKWSISKRYDKHWQVAECRKKRFRIEPSVQTFYILNKNSHE